MSDLLDAAVHLSAAWLWFLLLPPVAWFVHFVYHQTRPPVANDRVTVLLVLRVTIFAILVLLLAEPVLSYLARRALRPEVVTLIDLSASMEVEEGGVTRLDRIRRSMREGLVELLVGPVRAFSSSTQEIAPDSIDAWRATGQATDLAAALESAFTATSDPRLLAGIVLISDGRHNLGADPVRVATEHETPVFVLGVTSETSPDDVQIVDVVADGHAFAGKAVRLVVRLRNWGFQDSSVAMRLEEGDQIIDQIEVRLAADGQLQPVEFLTPPLSAGPHLLRVHIVPRSSELTPHNNQSLVPLSVRPSRIHVLLFADRPSQESAFVYRTLAADSTLQVDGFIGQDDNTFYRQETFPGKLESYDAVVLLAPVEPAMAISSGAMKAYIASGGGLLIQAPVTDDNGLSASWSDFLPTITRPVLAEVTRDEEPLHLVPEARSHPLLRGMTRGAIQDPWQRLPPLLARVSRTRVKSTARALLAAPDGDPVVVAGTYKDGRVVHVLGTGFWRQSLFGEAMGTHGQHVQGFWRSAVHWLALADSGGRVRASAEQPVFRSGQPVAVAAQVFDELNEPLADAEVQLSLTPGGRSLILDQVHQGTYRAELSELPVGSYGFRITARLRDTNIGQTEGTFLVESHTVESDDLRSDPEMLTAIARASGGQYRALEDWRELIHAIRPVPVLVREEQNLGVEIRHIAWLLLLTGLLTAEWVLRKRSGML